MAAPRKKTPAKRPAKDLKPGDMRSQMLKGKTQASGKKAPSGTLTERTGEARNRPYKGTKGGAVTRTEKPRVTGRQYSGDSIKMGQGSKGSVTKPKVVPLGDRPKLLSGPKPSAGTSMAGTIAKGLWRGVGGPAAMLVSMTTEAGRGSDKPSGPLMKGNRGGGPRSRQGSSSASMAKAKVRSTVWGEARPGAARAMGVSKVAPVDQRKIAEGNKKKTPVPPKPRLRPSVSQPQAQPVARKKTRPLTRYQRDN